MTPEVQGCDCFCDNPHLLWNHHGKLELIPLILELVQAGLAAGHSNQDGFDNVSILET